MALFSGLAAGLTTFFSGLGLSAGVSAFLIKTGAQLATSFLVQLLTRSQSKDAPQPAFGTVGQLQAGELVPRQFPLGKAMTSGSLVYANEWTALASSPNSWLCQVVALSDLPVKGLLGVMVNGVYVTLDGAAHPDLGFAVLDYRVSGVDFLYVKFYDGTQTVADPFLVSSIGTVDRPYEATRVGYGVAYAIIFAHHNTALFSGFPSFRFLLDSVALYDPSKDTTVGGSGTQRWATPATWGGDGDYLPVVQAYNVLRGLNYSGAWLYGFQGMSEYRVPATDWIARIGECRATVVENDGPQPRYRAGGMLAVDVECGSAIEQIMAACAGRIAESGGIYKPAVGIIPAAVGSFVDGDFITTEGQTLTPFKGLSEIINAVAASYPEPEEGFNMKAAPTLYNAAFEAADGGRRLPSSLQLTNVPYPEQVQRLQLAALTEARKDRRHNGSLGPEWIGLEPNDIVAWTSDRNGYVAKMFRVESVLDRSDAHVTIDLLEVDPTDYDWVTATDYTAQAKTPATINRPAAQTLPDFAVSATNIDLAGGSVVAPAIQLTWTAATIEDASGIKYKVRTAIGGVIKTRGTITNLDDEEYNVSDNLAGSTDYEVRAKIVAARETSWGPWLPVTTLPAATFGGGTAISAVTVTFASPSRAAFFDVAVVGATLGQKVMAAASIDMPAGYSEDELEMDPITVAGRVLSAGVVRLLVTSTGRLAGQRKINLMVT